MTVANSGFICVVQRQIGTVWTTIAQLLDVTGPSMSKSVADVTNKESTNRWREFITSLKDGGEVTFGIVYDPDDTTHIQLFTDIGADTFAEWRVVLDADDELAFDGAVVGFTPTGPLDGAQTADLTLKVSGEVTNT